MENPKVTSFEDLDVYKRSYSASLKVMKEILPHLPSQEKFDLRDQLSRSCKSIPRLIAEGSAKRFQRAGYQKYLTDSIGEANEMVVSLSHVKDIYPSCVNCELVAELIEEYKIIARQLFRLQESWSKFSSPKSRQLKE